MISRYQLFPSLRAVPSSQVANYLVEADVLPGQTSVWSRWTAMNAGGAEKEVMFLPPGEDAQGCVNGMRSLHFRKGYNKNFKEDTYFFDWYKFGYACLSDPEGVIHWDETVDYGANDCEAEKIYNVTCRTQPDDNYNQEVIRGFEIRRYETKGASLGGKGAMAYQMRDSINMRAICDFGHDTSPTAWGTFAGQPFGVWKETQGGYCAPARKHLKLKYTNVKKLQFQYMDDRTKNGQSFNMKLQCSARKTRRKKKKPAPATPVSASATSILASAGQH